MTAGFKDIIETDKITLDISINIRVIGIDSITDYYDVNIKYERLKEIESLDRDWTFVRPARSLTTLLPKNVVPSSSVGS